MKPSPKEEWDVYWKKQGAVSSFLYDAAAVFYRKFIIKPYLNHYLRKYFPQGAEVLHAGCGSGQVDTDIHQWLKVTAADLSLHALRLYERANPKAQRLVQADIFSTPFADRSFSGIYNLGVMEHFTVEEIRGALREFARLLKPQGRIVLFWPPKFGLSVRFLNTIHFMANKVFKRSLQLHPAEITLIEGRSHVEGICEGAGFRMIGYHFGIRDLFTQAVVVLERNF